VVVALRVAHLAGDGVAGALEGVHAHDRGQQRGAHHASLAGAVALVEGRDHAVGAVHAGEEVADRHAHTGRLVGGGAGQRHQARLALGDLVVAGAAALRPVVPETADRQHDESGVDLVQALDREAEPVEHAGAEVLDEHVAVAHQPGQCLATVVGLQVERDRLLVAVARQEVGRDRVVLRPDEGRPPPAGVVTGARGLDLDDAGAHVAEHHPRVRAGEGPGQVDDGGAVEGCAHGVLLVLCRAEVRVCRAPRA
jgi:hypothetical protein